MLFLHVCTFLFGSVAQIADQMELDYLSPPYASHVANSSALDMGFMGHYSMSNWCVEAVVYIHMFSSSESQHILLSYENFPSQERYVVEQQTAAYLDLLSLF